MCVLQEGGPREKAVMDLRGGRGDSGLHPLKIASSFQPVSRPTFASVWWATAEDGASLTPWIMLFGELRAAKLAASATNMFNNGVVPEG